MWVQMIKARLKPGNEAAFKQVIQDLHGLEQSGSGLVRSTAMRDQSDPSAVCMMVVFDSEEKARAREQDPRRQAGLAELQTRMASMFEGARQFTDYEVVNEYLA